MEKILKKIALSFLVVTTFYSCRFHKNLCDCYYRDTNFVFTKIYLNDTMFMYKFKNNMSNGVFEGTFYQQGNELCLETYKSNIIKVEENYNNKFIFFDGITNDTLKFVSYINFTERKSDLVYGDFYECPQNSVLSFREFDYSSVDSTLFTSGLWHITMYPFFQNEIWKIKRNAIQSGPVKLKCKK